MILWRAALSAAQQVSEDDVIQSVVSFQWGGQEDSSSCSTTVNLWPETFVDLDAEKHETWTLSPYFWWWELFLLQAELWRTLWWKQNCSHQKGSWHTARPCLLLVVEGRAESSIWGILCGSVCQGVVDQGWENMNLASQDYDSCECDIWSHSRSWVFSAYKPG